MVSDLKTLKRRISIQGKMYEVDFSSFDDGEIQKLKKSFNELDEDKTGTIGVEEIKEFLESVGLAQTTEEVMQNFFDGIDKDGDYQLDFPEFVARFAPRTEIIDDRVVQAFRNFAPVRGKFIDVLQVKRVLMKLGNNLFSEEEFNSTMKYLNLKETDVIEFEEFVKVWRERAKIFD